MTTSAPSQLILKSVEPQVIEDIVRDPALLTRSGERSPQQTTLSVDFWDTPDYRLYHQGLSIRVLQTDGTITAQLNQSGESTEGTATPREWVAQLSEPRPSLDVFHDTPLGPKLAEIAGSAPLEAVIKIKMLRTSCELAAPAGGTILLEADQGLMVCQDRNAPILELALTLKEGSKADLWALATSLAKSHPLIIESLSQYRRGLILAGVEAEPSSQAYPPIKAKKSLRLTLEDILDYCYQELFLAQSVFLSQPQEAEAVHQLRVKIRQLRSFIYFIKPLLPGEIYDRIQGDLRQWALNYAYLREIDALQASWDFIAGAHPELVRSESELSRVLQAERTAQITALSARKAEVLGTPLMLDLQARLEEALSADDPEFAMPTAAFMTLRLKKLLKRLRKELDQVDFADRSSLHALRIRGKKLRYAMVLLEGMLKKRQRQILLELRDLQQVLGQVCDAPRNISILDDLKKRYGGPELYFETGLCLGYQTCHIESLVEELKSGHFFEFL